MDSLIRDFRDGWRTLRRTPGVALVAGWVPARRALRVSPVETLRAE